MDHSVSRRALHRQPGVPKSDVDPETHACGSCHGSVSVLPCPTLCDSGSSVHEISQAGYPSGLPLPPPKVLANNTGPLTLQLEFKFTVLPHTACKLLGKRFKLLVPQFPPL